MNGKRNRRMIWLAVASGLATVGIVWLAVQAWNDLPEWALAAAGSPLAMRCLAAIIAGIVALFAIVALLVRVRPRAPAADPRRLHADQGGTAAIEMAFVAPLALMIFLVMLQAAILFNANMVVHYAAFAMARVAIVTVPLEIDEELHNLVYNPEVASNPASVKMELIRRAAVLALMPISARLSAAAGGTDQGGATVQTQTQGAFQRLGAKDRPWIRRVQPQYDYTNGKITVQAGEIPVTQIEIAQPDHWREGNRDTACPYRHTLQGDWDLEAGGWNYYTVCPYYPDRMDYWYWEDLKLRLTYQFLLEVPYASRFMGQQAQVAGLEGNQYATEIRVFMTLSNEGGPELKPKDMP